ncbi:MAG: hypothetical protein EZS28_035033 [Streblomastix strix]|uniref:Uncharacterized protein n=1 Tax=Streblomastix strix TaxID=222440 RepID=A0A5J4UHJ8_9EUKA|nr:MAG: hypothetical protein EZS28_035031 [Streblomastix strix]KAA6369442.1 MAG: hypothetical protein EZS28_035033 [Streblomastix strix]
MQDAVKLDQLIEDKGFKPCNVEAAANVDVQRFKKVIHIQTERRSFGQMESPGLLFKEEKQELLAWLTQCVKSKQYSYMHDQSPSQTLNDEEQRREYIELGFIIFLIIGRISSQLMNIDLTNPE